MKYFFLSLVGLLLLTSSVRAEGEHSFYVFDDVLGSVDNYAWGESIIVHDSGTLSRFAVRGIHYGGTNKYTVQVYYCDIDMTPDFGQLLGISENNSLGDPDYQWTNFDFINPIQIMQDTCYFFVVTQQDSGYPFTNLVSSELLYNQSVFPNNHLMWVDVDGSGLTPYAGLSIAYDYTLDGDVIHTGVQKIDDLGGNLFRAIILVFLTAFVTIWIFRYGVRSS